MPKALKPDPLHKTFSEEELRRAREARNAYARNWRKKNPGKQEIYMTRLWLKKAAELLDDKNQDQ